MVFFYYIYKMKKRNATKKIEWTPILKYKTEVFDLKEHHNYNRINLLKKEETEDIDPFDFLTLERERHNGRTATPYVEKTTSYKDEFSTKHVEVAYFTPKESHVGFCGKEVDEETWLKEGINIFNSASVNRTTIVLEKNKEKLKFSIFKFDKTRQAGHRYFAKHSKDIHITFNLKTKNFFITTSTFGGRKRVTTTTKNDFQKIVTILNSITDISILNRVSYSTVGIYPLLHKVVQDFPEFIIELREKLSEELQVEVSFEKGLGTGLGYAIMEWFIKQWGIKVSNDYYQYLITHYPGIRYLRKFNMNLIRTILHKKKLNGKYYIKLLNTMGCINLTDLKELEEFFGERHVKLLPLSFLKISNSNIDMKYEHITLGSTLGYTLTKYEKLNLIKVLKEVSDCSFITQLHDHMVMKTKLGDFGIKKYIKAKTLKQFGDEHVEWSNLIHLCERNKETVYEYDAEFVKYMEEDIVCDKEHHEVIILKTDLDYFDEGQYQRHCVRSYVDRYKSLIISVRKGEERMTSEFAPNGVTSLGSHPTPSITTFAHTQSQMKFNQPATGTWKHVNDCLIFRLNLYFKDHSFEFPIIHLSNKVSGKKQKLVWDEKNGFISEEEKIQNCILEDLPF